jgi:hypothetical protein
MKVTIETSLSELCTLYELADGRGGSVRIAKSQLARLLRDHSRMAMALDGAGIAVAVAELNARLAS